MRVPFLGVGKRDAWVSALAQRRGCPRLLATSQLALLVLAEFAIKQQKKRQIRVRAGAGPLLPAPPPRAPEFGVIFFSRKSQISKKKSG